MKKIGGRQYSMVDYAVIPPGVKSWCFADVGDDKIVAEGFASPDGAFRAMQKYVAERNVSTMMVVMAEMGADLPLIVQSTY